MTSEPGIAGTSSLVRVVDLEKTYRTGHGDLSLFRHLSFTIGAGEIVAIAGESGAGKSTLLHLLAALDRQTAGEVFVGEICLSQLSPRQKAEFRNRKTGYVWQSHDLLPEFTAEENVAMPLLARGMPRQDAMTRARRWLAEVEVSNRADHRSGELSGGEQQRVCLARALVTEPALLLADEPTGNLDNRTAEVIFGLLQRLHHTHGTTTVLVTHNQDFARRCDRVLLLQNGSLIGAVQQM